MALRLYSIAQSHTQPSHAFQSNVITHLRGVTVTPDRSLEDGSYGASFGSLGLGAFCAVRRRRTRVQTLKRLLNLLVSSSPASHGYFISAKPKVYSRAYLLTFIIEIQRNIFCGSWILLPINSFPSIPSHWSSLPSIFILSTALHPVLLSRVTAHFVNPPN